MRDLENPSNPDYLLDNNELFDLLKDEMRIISYQDGIVSNNVQMCAKGFLPLKVLIGLI